VNATSSPSSVAAKGSDDTPARAFLTRAHEIGEQHCREHAVGCRFPAFLRDELTYLVCHLAPDERVRIRAGDADRAGIRDDRREFLRSLLEVAKPKQICGRLTPSCGTTAAMGPGSAAGSLTSVFRTVRVKSTAEPGLALARMMIGIIRRNDSSPSSEG
jgi:hypothetical protein